MNSSRVSPSRQWKYLELESKHPIISKIINSNMVNERANVMEKTSCTNTCRIS